MIKLGDVSGSSAPAALGLLIMNDIKGGGEGRYDAGSGATTATVVGTNNSNKNGEKMAQRLSARTLGKQQRGFSLQCRAHDRNCRSVEILLMILK